MKFIKSMAFATSLLCLVFSLNACSSKSKSAHINDWFADFDTEKQENRLCTPSPIRNRAYIGSYFSDYGNERFGYGEDYTKGTIYPLIEIDYYERIEYRYYHRDLVSVCDTAKSVLSQSYSSMQSDGISDEEFAQLKSVYEAQKEIIKDEINKIKNNIDEAFRKQKELEKQKDKDGLNVKF